MAMSSRKNGDKIILDQENLLPEPKRIQRRWKMAYTVIYFIRLLVSFSKKDLDSQTEIPGSTSYAAIDVHDDTSPCENKTVSLINSDQRKIIDMVRKKSLEILNQFGGVLQVAIILKTDVKDGVGEVDVAHRRDVFGENSYKKSPSKRFLSYVLEECKDPTIIILLFCAIMSLGFAIKLHGLRDGWYDGGSIILSTVHLVAVSAISKFMKSNKFEKLFRVRNDIKVQVVRDGRQHEISIFDVVVGDVVYLNKGDQIPADGLLLNDSSLKVDESSMSSEMGHAEEKGRENPFLLSGTKVAGGNGFMLVTSVGMNTAWGEMMSSRSHDLDEQTPLRSHLDKIISYMRKVGWTVALLVLVVLLMRYFTRNTRDDNGYYEYNGSKTKINDVLDPVVHIIVAAVTIGVVATPEGLSLAITLTYLYFMKRMMKERVMVRELSACEKMGSATTIIIDKKDILTLNQMEVVEFFIGEDIIKAKPSNGEIESKVLELLQEGAALNTTCTVYKPQSTSILEISGSPTEKAMLPWAMSHLGINNVDEEKKKVEIKHVENFDPDKNGSGVLLVRRNNEKVVRHRKGDAKVILAMCSNYYVRNGEIRNVDEDARKQLKEIIRSMAVKSLCCVAFACKEVEDGGQASDELEAAGFTLLGLVGLKDPCRIEVRTAVESCKNAGVKVILVTGDDVRTARATAIECGVFSCDQEDVESDAIVEGVQFSNYSREQRMERIGKILVMGSSSPSDKLEMIRCLKEEGHVVAVTGGGTNDALALKEADIELSMGIRGTEVAKESSNIVILDDNFISVVTMLSWGRCVHNNIQKFIQFQLTMNVAALVINLISACSSGVLSLSAFQILWEKVIIDTLGLLAAISHDQPTKDLMRKPPVCWYKRPIDESIFNNILIQVFYQAVTLSALQFNVGKSILGLAINNTLVFNTSVICQVFNIFTARLPVEKKSMFMWIRKNKRFLAAVLVVTVAQGVIVELSSKVTNSSEKLDRKQWCVSLSIAASSWLFDQLVRRRILLKNNFLKIKKYIFNIFLN
jgi:Ca2+-transporting ATPase